MEKLPGLTLERIYDLQYESHIFFKDVANSRVLHVDSSLVTSNKDFPIYEKKYPHGFPRYFINHEEKNELISNRNELVVL